MDQEKKWGETVSAPPEPAAAPAPEEPVSAPDMSTAPTQAENTPEPKADAAPAQAENAPESEADAVPMQAENTPEPEASAAPMQTENAPESGADAAPAQTENAPAPEADAAPMQAENTPESETDAAPARGERIHIPEFMRLRHAPAPESRDAGGMEENTAASGAPEEPAPAQEDGRFVPSTSPAAAAPGPAPGPDAPIGHSPDEPLQDAAQPLRDDWEELILTREEPAPPVSGPQQSAPVPPSPPEEPWGAPPPPPVQRRAEPGSVDDAQGAQAPHARAWQSSGAAPSGAYGQPHAGPGTPYPPPPVPPPYAAYGQPGVYGQPGAYGRPGVYGQPGAYGQPGPYAPYGAGAWRQPPAPPAGQPHPWQQPGFGGMPPYAPYGQPAAPARPRPRAKTRAGVRVFLVVLGVLVLASLVGIGATIVNRSLAGMSADDFPGNSVEDWQDTPYFPFDPDGGEGDGWLPDGSGESEPELPGNLPELIYAQEGITIRQKPEGEPLSAVEIYERNVDSVVGVTAQYDGEMSQGSGIVLTENGYLVTNAHVVLYTSESLVTVKLHDGTEYPAIVVGYEEDSDLAVLRIDATGLTPAELGDASELQVGEEVFAIGNPGGDRYGSTLTGGYVSGLNRELEKSVANGLTYIQTDAAINPGNSGGALVNGYGQVVGINSNKVVSTSYEGIGFAIPISEASKIIDDLMTKGYVTGRGRLGITARTVTELQAETSGIPVGVLIVSVDEDSPLKGIAFAGDIITEAAGEEITSLDDLYAVLRTHGGGERITVTIYNPGTAETKSSETQYTIELLADTGETQN